MNKEIIELLEIALCPNVVNGCKDGILPNPYGEMEKCQWCDERTKALNLLNQQPTAGKYDRRTTENTHICPCGNIFVEADDYDTLGSESGVCCPDCGNENFQTVKDCLDTAEARSIDCPNRPASKTEVEMAKRICDYQDEVHELKQQPTVGEFTKKVHLNLDSWNTVLSLQEDCRIRIIVKWLKEACDRLDTAEVINKELLDVCVGVQDWLDTSSLQQILVHRTEDTRRHALIMGIATHLERLEAAIAKAKRNRQ